MSDVKIAGCCTVCDIPCFDVREVFAENELYPGEPKSLGRPTSDAKRITFVLIDGTKTHLTFCGNCAASITSSNYTDIWRKVIRSWQRELKGETPSWYLEQFSNGLLGEVDRQQWTEIV